MILLSIVLANLAIQGTASAQESDPEVEIFSVEQQDLNGDGRLDLAIIDCAFITDRDRVHVYDRGEDMESSEVWQQATDFRNDLWVFDAAADGQIELIIDFRESRLGLEAWLWDDQNGDGTVPFKPYPELTVREKFGPAVKVIALDDWWARDGKTNFNLDLVVDGTIQASFSAKNFLRYVETDGTPDFLIQVRDTDEDGRPDYQWVDAWPRARSGFGTRRTEITYNPKDDEPGIKGSIFWPYLGSTFDWDEQRLDRLPRLQADQMQILQEWSGYTKFYNLSMPPIQMLWDKGLLLYVGEFVASRFNDDNWFVYSINRVQPDEISQVNFEAPFAFYDIAEDNDGYPELAIRFEQYLKQDFFPFRGKNIEPVQILRYSWDQDNNTAWDYKLGLIGRHQITNTVTVGDLNLVMIPPSSLPDWVVGRSWDGATLVADEARGQWTSEGIYEWGPSDYWRDEYVTGFSRTRPSQEQLGVLPIGQRGEYAFDLHRKPGLYLSPIDRKLHLLGAEGGVWEIDERREIRYANLGGDYLNQWTLLDNGSPSKEIYFVSNHIIYWDESGFQLIRTASSPALFVNSPPTNNKERLDLERQMQTYQQDLDPWDFNALLAQFGRPHLRVERASIRDLRLTSEGFRFVIELPPGFRASSDSMPDLSTLTPGKYLVNYDGEFTIEPLTPPDLSLSLQLPSPQVITKGQPIPVFIEAKNEGMEDKRDLSLSVQVRAGDSRIEIARQRVDILSGIPTQLALSWNPLLARKGELQAWVRDPEGWAVLAEVSQPVEVAQSVANTGRILQLSTGGGWHAYPLIALILAFIFAAFRFVFQTIWKSEEENDYKQQKIWDPIAKPALRLRHNIVAFMKSVIRR